MVNVSNEFLEVMQQPAQRRICRGTIGTTNISNKNIIQGSTTITNQCSGSTDINIGQVYIGELQTVLRGLDIPRRSFKGKEIVLYQGLLIDEENLIWEDVLLGHFFIDKAEWTLSGISITAYDAMYKFDKNMTYKLNTGTMYDYVLMACTVCGVTLGMTQQDFFFLPNAFSNFMMYDENDIETWRDLISWCAQTMGCNATINRNGELVFLKYGQTISGYYDTKRRLEGASFSDFDSFYTGISFVNIADQTTSYYGLEIDNGLTMNLGSNPFLQYDINSSLESSRRNVLNAVAEINYTPARVRLNALMIYDLMDVIQFSGGFAGGTVNVCITKYTWKLNGDYVIECVGSDPALASAKSKTDKNISGLLSTVDENKMHYYDTLNVNPITINHNETVSIISIRYGVKRNTHIDFHAEVNYSLTTNELDGDFVTNNDGQIQVIYYLDGSEVVEYHPLVSEQDGMHLLHLLYFWNGIQDTVGTFEVYIKAINCTIFIDAACCRSYIGGQGLLGMDEWDGYIYAKDTFNSLYSVGFLQPTDSVNVSTHIPYSGSASDDFSLLSIGGSIIGNITDSMNDLIGMIFTTIVNVNMLTRTATISNNKFVNGYVITPNIIGFTKVTSISAGCSFYASFDYGVTWSAYSSSDGWVEGSSMNAQELEAVPPEAWSDGMIKINIGTDASLTEIVFEGGSINV